MNSDRAAINFCGKPKEERRYSCWDDFAFVAATDSIIEAVAALTRAKGVSKTWSREEVAKEVDDLRGYAPDVTSSDTLPSPSDVYAVIRATDLSIVGPDIWHPNLGSIERAYADLMNFVAYKRERPGFRDLSDHEKTHLTLRLLHAFLKSGRYSNWQPYSSNEEAYTDVFCGEGDPRKRKALSAHDLYLDLYMLANEFRVRCPCTPKRHSKNDYKLVSDAQSSLQAAKNKLVALRAGGLGSNHTNSSVLDFLDQQIESVKRQAKSVEADIAAPKPKHDALRKFIVGPLLNQYTEFFGYYPGRSSDGASGPWSRFGVQFFRAVGKEVTPATLYTALKDAPKSLLGKRVTGYTAHYSKEGVRTVHLTIGGSRPRPNRSHRAGGISE